MHLARRAGLTIAAAFVALAAACTGIIGGPFPSETAEPEPTVDAAAPSATDAGCPRGQIACADECVDPSTSFENCGQCGQRCSAGTACVAGSCQLNCADGQLACSGSCVTTVSDPHNCGGCATSCPAGKYCSVGTCSDTCELTTCETNDGVVLCVDPKTDPSSCGACGAACPPGQSCVDGICSTSCPAGQKACGNDCVSTATDAKHCGGCDHACAAGQPCIQGNCGCSGGLMLCAGDCVNTQSSASSCGGCGMPCPSATACISGKCSCGAGKASCGGQCVDTAASPNCGGCGVTCNADELCDNGACKPKSAGCTSGTVLCGTSCVDTQTSAVYCGNCETACPAAQVCSAGRCECPNAGALCGTDCVDVRTDNANCGGCGLPCTGGTSCTAGGCACPNDLLLCGGACVDTTASNENCGGCGKPCLAGRTCQASQCACPNGARDCAGTCVDTQTDDNNCGGCGAACSGGSRCSGGVCRCPSGLSLCNDACIDTRASTTDCGACNAPCAPGQSCSEGVCTGGGGTGTDGCSSDLAYDLTLQQIAVYQSVKIPVMTDFVETQRSARNSDVVQGRDTMVRVFVTLGAGWTARELSARLTLTDEAAASSQYYSKKTIAASSSEADPTTTFQIAVPAAAMSGPLRYSVEVVECTSRAGAVQKARFPTTLDLDLGVRSPGGLEIKIIPMQVDAYVPDTSATALAVYSKLMTAMYPINGITLTVGDTVTTTAPVNWNNMLDQIRAKRQQDAPPADVYYYGLVKPADTFRNYCGTSCTTGIGFVTGPNSSSTRVAVGIGFADKSSAETMAHEVGHNHGRNHAPCSSGSISGVDPSYPYSGGKIGSWGYDSRTAAMLDPAKYNDIMGYCANKWISDYTYKAITTRVALVNGAAMVYFEPALVSKWRVLLLDDQGPRWGIPIDRETAPDGDPEPARILDASGAAVATVQVYRTLIGDALASMVLVPEPRAGWHSVAVVGERSWPFDAPVTVPRP